MDQLANSEINSRWGRILENSFDEIYVFDAQTLKFIQVSKGALQNLGYSLEEMQQLTALDIKPDMSEQRFNKLLMQLREGHKDLLVFETRHQRKNGTTYSVEVRLQLAPEDPQPVFVAIILDITQRQQAEEEIRKRERIFHSLAKVSPVGIFRTDTRGQCIYMNERCLALTGLPPHEALGEGWAAALHPDDRVRVLDEWYHATQTQSRFLTECRFLRTDGTVTWLLAQAAEERDSQGNIQGYVGCITDITEQKQVEEALNRSIYEWNYAMDYIEDTMVLIDLDDKIVRANKAFYQASGLTPEQTIGCDPADIFHPNVDKSLCPVCQARMARSDARIILEANHASNSSGRPLEKHVRIIRDDKGKPQSILTATRDLTQQREIENRLRDHRDQLERQVAVRTRELEISNKELESFSYSIAHDLRAPLRSITSFSQIVMEDAGARLDEEELENLQRVVDAGKHMTEIIDDILELSRVSRVDLEREAVDMTSLANICIQRLQESDPTRKVEVNIQPELIANGDRKLLSVLLDNLLGNAWKYTQKTENAFIELGHTTKNAETVFYVQDNGVGFDMQYADKLFGVFQRLHKAGEFEGTGIGLASVQRIIDRHGGKIWADAQPNAGATFYFTLG